MTREGEGVGGRDIAGGERWVTLFWTGSKIKTGDFGIYEAYDILSGIRGEKSKGGKKGFLVMSAK